MPQSLVLYSVSGVSGARVYIIVVYDQLFVVLTPGKSLSHETQNFNKAWALHTPPRCYHVLMSLNCSFSSSSPAIGIAVQVQSRQSGLIVPSNHFTAHVLSKQL